VRESEWERARVGGRVEEREYVSEREVSERGESVLPEQTDDKQTYRESSPAQTDRQTDR
jgi:hypothetical protein